MVYERVPHAANCLDDFILVDPERAEKLLSTFRIESKKVEK